MSYATAVPTQDWSVRACQCTFCRKHNSKNTSDPKGNLRLRLPDDVVRYRFGLKTSDFVLCPRCGVYVAAVIEIDGRAYATVNLTALDVVTPEPEPVVYDAEETASRIERRRERWTPVVDVHLRELVDADLDEIFEHEQDETAQQMAAFIGDDPSNREKFDAHWARIRGLDTVMIRTILLGEQVAGHIASFDRGDEREVTYWIDRHHWGRGVATDALKKYLALETTRPLFGRVAADNVASRRVLEACGFAEARQERGFAAARGQEIDEVVLSLS